MNIRPSKREDVEVNITPLIDVVFLLLIFFMVTTTFDSNSELNIALPEASQEVKETKPDAINIAIDADNVIYINGNALVNGQLETIKDALNEATVGINEAPIIINADANTSHQFVVRAMDAARQLGLVKITFATRVLVEE